MHVLLFLISSFRQGFLERKGLVERLGILWQLMSTAEIEFTVAIDMFSLPLRRETLLKVPRTAVEVGSLLIPVSSLGLSQQQKAQSTFPLKIILLCNNKKHYCPLIALSSR